MSTPPSDAAAAGLAASAAPSTAIVARPVTRVLTPREKAIQQISNAMQAQSLTVACSLAAFALLTQRISLPGELYRTTTFQTREDAERFVQGLDDPAMISWNCESGPFSVMHRFMHVAGITPSVYFAASAVLFGVHWYLAVSDANDALRQLSSEDREVIVRDLPSYLLFINRRA